jgi:hypothetical protein
VECCENFKIATYFGAKFTANNDVCQLTAGNADFQCQHSTIVHFELIQSLLQRQRALSDEKRNK